MDPLLDAHNLHRIEGPTSFRARDPTLRRVSKAPLQYRSALIDRLPFETPGIYTLGGGRQVGKTTLVKQAMAELLERGAPPDAVTYLTGEILSGENALRRELVEASVASESRMTYIFVDEITYVPQWDQAVKFLADSGVLENVFLLLTGSDLVLMQDALKRLPGRRGRAREVDFHYDPLDYLQFCRLRNRLNHGALEELASAKPAAEVPSRGHELIQELYGELDDYLVTGGYLTAINDLERDGYVAQATLRIYSDWVRGDVLRLNRNETYLREVLRAILARYGSQVTWNSLSRELSIDHPKTVSDYCAILERMDAALTVPALREDRLSAAPKKAKKLYFADPFIRHSVRALLEDDTSDLQRADLQSDPTLVAGLVESLFPLHCRRFAPTFYIKARHEVDCAYIEGNSFWPIEVKWRRNFDRKSVAGIARYPNGLIAARTSAASEIDAVPVRPIPVVLLRLSARAHRTG